MRFNVLIASSSNMWMNSLVLQEVNLKKPCERKNFFQGFFSALKYGDDEKQMVLYVKFLVVQQFSYLLYQEVMTIYLR